MSQQVNTAPEQLPVETVTPKNLALAIKNLGGMLQSAEAMIEAGELPGNEIFADRILDRAIQVCNMGLEMDAASPV